MEPSRFWLRRDNDDRARQVVFDEVQLDRYSDRQRRAILKVMARGKTASHRDIRDAARRARRRPRGEILIAITLAVSVLAVLIIVFVDWRSGPGKTVTAKSPASGNAAVDHAASASPGDLTTVMENADRDWLNDVGAGKVVTANDGSDALSLPQAKLPAALPAEPSPGARSGGDWRHRQRP